MDIKQQIALQRKWIEIDKDTLEQVIEEGQPDEIIESEKEHLRKDEAILEQLLKEAEMNIDRDYYIAAICEEFPADGLSDEQYFKAVNEAIDKTISQCHNEVDNCDVFEQDLYNNVEEMLQEQLKNGG